MEYTDKVLIKLRRKYSKDETVAALNKKIKEFEFENGKLSAEVAYLEHEVKDNTKWQGEYYHRESDMYNDIDKFLNS